MGYGHLIVSLTIEDQAMPISYANVIILDENNNELYTLKTDESGNTPKVELQAPDKYHTLQPEAVVPYSMYNININAQGYYDVIIKGVKILDTSLTIQPVNMVALPKGEETRVNKPIIIDEGEHHLRNPQTRFILTPPAAPRILRDVVIPQYITVHLGRPEVYATNVRVPFKDYIKNVASNEIYDTWNENALIANIYCIISFTLNRIYTEFYRSQGYSFDITNSTSIDHIFVNGSAFGGNISAIVDRIFNRYLAQVGHKEPFISHYCDGNKSKCPGWLSQWGSCYDAENGLSYQQIIHKYYIAYDLQFRETNIINGVTQSYPGSPLKQGASGENVKTIQEQLNRIRQNYPLIPIISPSDGYFGQSTTDAVKKFQQIFNLTADGIVGPSTWYQINKIYIAVKRLAEMDSEGQPGSGGGNVSPGPIMPIYPGYLLKEGSTGENVKLIQSALSYLSQFYPQIPNINVDGKFGPLTRSAVIQFQKLFNLSADGIVGPATWNKLKEQVSVDLAKGLLQFPEYEGNYENSNVLNDNKKINTFTKDICLIYLFIEYSKIKRRSQ